MLSQRPVFELGGVGEARPDRVDATGSTIGPIQIACSIVRTAAAPWARMASGERGQIRRVYVRGIGRGPAGGEALVEPMMVNPNRARPWRNAPLSLRRMRSGARRSAACVRAAARAREQPAMPPHNQRALGIPCASLDDLVGTGKQRRRYNDPQHLGSL
jgi:hypothetical protein